MMTLHPTKDVMKSGRGSFFVVLPRIFISIKSSFRGLFWISCNDPCLLPFYINAHNMLV